MEEGLTEHDALISFRIYYYRISVPYIAQIEGGLVWV